MLSILSRSEHSYPLPPTNSFTSRLLSSFRNGQWTSGGEFCGAPVLIMLPSFLSLYFASMLPLLLHHNFVNEKTDRTPSDLKLAVRSHAFRCSDVQALSSETETLLYRLP